MAAMETSERSLLEMLVNDSEPMLTAPTVNKLRWLLRDPEPNAFKGLLYFLLKNAEWAEIEELLQNQVIDENSVLFHTKFE